MIGTKQGRLTVVSFLRWHEYPCGQKRRLWVCRCVCGNECVKTSSSIKQAKVPSCGCFASDVLRVRNTTHGESSGSGTRAYRLYRAMLSRCYNPNSIGYRFYGARGIRVCRRWRGPLGFQNFKADMGVPPCGLSIDRKNCRANYSPRNCRWATPTQQANNRRTNHFIKCGKSRLTLAQVDALLGRKRGATANRIALGWSDHEAVTIPIGMSRKEFYKTIGSNN